MPSLITSSTHFLLVRMFRGLKNTPSLITSSTHFLLIIFITIPCNSHLFVSTRMEYAQNKTFRIPTYFLGATGII